MKETKGNVLIVNTINQIPSNQQYYHLGLKVNDLGYTVIHVKDNSRTIDSYPGRILYWRGKDFIKSLIFFGKIIAKYRKFEVVILNFQARKYSFIFYPFSRRVIITTQSDFFPKNVIGKAKYSLNCLFSTDIVTLTEFMKAKMIRKQSLSENKITVFNNSIRINDINKTNEDYIKPPIDEEIKVIFVGNLGYHKGFDMLIEYFINFSNPKISLVVVGAGPLESLIDGSQKNVQFYGKLFHAHTMRAMKESHFLISPSRNEAFGQVIIEAYALDTVPVVIKGTGTEELILQGKTGFIGNTIEECFEFISTIPEPQYLSMVEEIRGFRQRFETNVWVDNMVKKFF